MTLITTTIVLVVHQPKGTHKFGGVQMLALLNFCSSVLRAIVGHLVSPGGRWKDHAAPHGEPNDPRELGDYDHRDPQVLQTLVCLKSRSRPEEDCLLEQTIKRT
jgi:hypothetical protein